MRLFVSWSFWSLLRCLVRPCLFLLRCKVPQAVCPALEPFGVVGILWIEDHCLVLVGEGMKLLSGELAHPPDPVESTLANLWHYLSLYTNAGTEARRVAVASGALLADESKGETR